jgi:hypothetical protein
LTARFDRSRRDVDRDDTEPARLGFKAVPAGPTADVENPSPHELKNLLLRGGPVAVFGEEDVRGERRACAAVVELEHHLTRLARKVIEQQTPESVLLFREWLDSSIRSVSPMHR